MATIQQYKFKGNGSAGLIETVYAIIKSRSGKVTSKDLVALIRKHGGTASLTTVSGGKLKARLSGDKIVITDAKGGVTAVTQADVVTANGVVHVTDGVFLPA